jgi:peroxiredoxin
MVSIKLGAKAVPFTLTGVDDKEHSLSDYKNKEAVAVIFSCNHCPYVKAWEDRMVQIQKEYGPKGVQLVAINANDTEKHPDDSFPKMKERAREKGFNFPYLIDTTQEVARTYGSERTPEIFLFDKNGTLRYHGAIDDNYEDPKAVKQQWFRSALDAVLAGKEPAIKETKAVGCTIKWK